MPLPILHSPLTCLSIYECRSFIYITGLDEFSGKYKILEVARPAGTLDFQLTLRQDPALYTASQLDQRLKSISVSNFGLSIVVEGAYCLWGFIKLLESYYIIVVSKAKKVGSIQGHYVYGIEKTQMVPVTFKPRQTKEETKYKNILTMLDLTKNFYFSYTYDLSNSLQKNSTFNISNNNNNKFLKCNDAFIWNSFALKPLLDIFHNNDPMGYHMIDWIVPIIYGYFKQRLIRIKHDQIIRYILIARRSRHFAGTRYLRRGVNRYVASYCDVSCTFSTYECTYIIS